MGIQAGIQAGHAYQKCFFKNTSSPIMLAHAGRYEVWKILSCGGQSQIIETADKIHELAYEFGITVPNASFRESEEDLNNVLTSWCFILPFMEGYEIDPETTVETQKAAKRLFKFCAEVKEILPHHPAR